MNRPTGVGGGPQSDPDVIVMPSDLGNRMNCPARAREGVCTNLFGIIASLWQLVRWKSRARFNVTKTHPEAPEVGMYPI